MRNKKINFGAMGYYIALVLCALAIGITGYMYFQNANKDEPQLQNPTQNNPQDLPVIGTQDPSDPASTRPDPTQGQTQPAPTEPSRIRTCLPVQGKTVMPYAMDVLCYNETTRDWRTHNGLDIEAEAGTAVVAAADGTVYSVYDDDRLGQTVVILHANGYATRYSSLADQVAVKPGDTVTMGQTIGSVGSTAIMESALSDHVHFSVTCNDVPVDPDDFLNQE